jgi:hypothetical protein
MENVPITTHKDKIWQFGCQLKEDEIIAQLETCTQGQAIIKVIDSILTSDIDVPKDKPIITDNHFNNTPENIIQVGPEFWGIFYFNNNTDFNITPTYDFNCLMNRISGERLMILYKIYERDLLDDNIVSFNCFLPGMERKNLTLRRMDFNDMHIDQDWPHWNDLQEELRPRMPLLLPTDMDPDSAMLHSKVTFVVETYSHDNVISYSEKIFRALQTPRPWVLFASPNAVSVLRDYGFDVLDDIVDHCAYDSTVRQERRVDKILNLIPKIEFNFIRCASAAAHNRHLLQVLFSQWPAKLEKICKQFN